MSIRKKAYCLVFIFIVGVCGLLSIALGKDTALGQLQFINANSSSFKYMVIVTHGWVEKGRVSSDPYLRGIMRKS